MASTSTLPVLLPANAGPPKEESPFEWRPTRDLSNPVPPPPEDMTPEQEAAAAKLSLDGKFRKVRPRRTVDYGGPMGRWTLVSSTAIWKAVNASPVSTPPDYAQLRKLRPSSTYKPYLRPAPPYIIDVGRTHWSMYIASAHKYICYAVSCFHRRRTRTMRLPRCAPSSSTRLQTKSAVL